MAIGTQYLLSSTYYLVPNTCCLVPVTWYLIPVSRYPSTRKPACATASASWTCVAKAAGARNSTTCCLSLSFAPFQSFPNVWKKVLLVK